MNREVNICTRQAILSVADAIQDLSQVFTDGRIPTQIISDLLQAKERLLAAIGNIDTAFNFV